MPADQKRVIVRVDSNPNLKVTVDTKNHLGVSAVCAEDEVEARTLGIPGPPGLPGMVWRGQFDEETRYTKNDVVNFDGILYIYVNDTPFLSALPPNNPSVWELFLGEPSMRIEIDELQNGDIYVGKALPNVQTNESKWSIKKITFINNDIRVLWANGDSSYNKVWDDRDTYTY